MIMQRCSISSNLSFPSGCPVFTLQAHHASHESKRSRMQGNVLDLIQSSRSFSSDRVLVLILISRTGEKYSRRLICPTPYLQQSYPSTLHGR
jgi:cell division FtsZ-interacting protein ZapD